MPNKISVMPTALANLIAAGEVVERPASALKELVENAIDANSSHVFVDIVGGGLKSMTVKDDGSGMDDVDARLCLLRHASSKIKTTYDLMDIKTLGFRGEALPSIVAVSRFSMDTSDGSEGTHVEAHGEENPSFSRAPLRKGTTIKISDLFYNTPARLKYMKSEQVERAKCLDTMEHLALGFPKVSFDVRTDGKEVFSTSGRGDTVEVIQRIWGNVLARDVVEAQDLKETGFSIEAFLAKPEINYASRFQIMTFLNRRYIYSFKLSKAVEEAYRDYLSPLRYPFAVIKITADPSLVDVNVHPSKREVRISNEDELATRVKKLTLDTLAKEKPVYSNLGNGDYLEKEANKDDALLAVHPIVIPATGNPMGEENPRPLKAREDETPITQGLSNVSFQGNDVSEVRRLMAGNGLGQEIAAPFSDEESSKASDRVADQVEGGNPYENLLPLGQIANTYIVCEAPDGLCIIDQHAAAERVNFEKMEDLFSKSIKKVQPLQAVIVDLPPSIVSAFDQEKKDRLSAMGFEVSGFGTSSLKLDSLPEFLTNKDYESVIKDLITSVAKGEKVEAKDLLRKAISTLACHASVRAGQPLSPQEEVAIIRELGKCRNPANCPHGRPTVIRISIHDLEHLFKRTGF